ncbi:hypothetical protein CAPTEDRAFT_197715 [Capitella teleta]|uniref:C-type lectin domain-containing protein n=1 Tax=Capitella teleta TaxID=283909 RepID=R7TYQ7_CAPTE|nr:hypothetical protein CAPTEDRAFT_197715 [Capitella teleta]|eukprot:ELT99058.1 hypothetical protein CAPTEDRAFT_197715 [Capitella teleta]
MEYYFWSNIDLSAFLRLIIGVILFGILRQNDANCSHISTLCICETVNTNITEYRYCDPISPRVNFAKDSPTSLPIARERCAQQSSRLPDLSSVKDGSLLSKLEVGQSTWVDDRIERGPWRWHSSDYCDVTQVIIILLTMGAVEQADLSAVLIKEISHSSHFKLFCLSNKFVF